MMQDDLCKKGSYIESRHFENKGVTKRKHVKPETDYDRYQSIHPDTTDWAQTGWLTFTIRTGNEFVRMVPNCITFFLTPEICLLDPVPDPITYTPTSPFEGVTTTVGGVTTVTGNKRSFFFNPLAGAPATLINEIEIILDGQRVQINTGGYFSATNTINKLFCPSYIRNQVLSHNHVLHNENNRKTYFQFYGHGDKGIFKNQDYEYALNELNSKSTKPGGKRICQVSGDIDGMLYLSRPKNLTLNSITECDQGKNQHPILPPHTELVIKMRLNDPLTYRCIDTQMSDDVFFSDAVNISTGDSPMPPSKDRFLKGSLFKLSIHDVTLNIERVRWKKEKIQRRMGTGAIDITFDEYLFRSKSLPGNASTTNSAIDIPPNISLIYVMFVRSNQLLFDNEGNRGSDLTRFVLPEKIMNIEFKLDQERILFSNNLQISRNDAHSQKSARLFYDYLVHRNMTNESFETFFPNGDNNISYKHVFPIDLTNDVKDKPTLFEVNVTWNPRSPSDYYCLCFIPRSVNVHKPSRDSIWTSTATVG